MNRETEIKEAVKQAYTEVAEGRRCCTTDLTELRLDRGGYTAEEMASLPAGAAMGLGCGNPTSLAPIGPGMTVLDLGCGAGVDVFLAARKAGPGGRVIGVDMTESMLQKARSNAAAGGYTNVEFRLGEIESLPVESGTVDVILSNCVINLAPDKDRVFAEAYRVLKPGGRLQVSDMVTEGAMPQSVQRDMEKWAGCLAGAIDRDVYLEKLRQAGFAQVEIAGQFAYDQYKSDTFAALSISVVARK
jgi:arsenite methyltransferase